MDALMAYVQMGGYGAFVWPAFLITLAVLGLLLVASHRSLRTRRSLLDALEADLKGHPRARRRS